jgi:hypothetical protein
MSPAAVARRAHRAVQQLNPAAEHGPLLCWRTRASGSVREMWSDRDDAVHPIGSEDCRSACACRRQEFLVPSARRTAGCTSTASRARAANAGDAWAFDAIRWPASTEEGGGSSSCIAGECHARYLIAPRSTVMRSGRVTPAESPGTNGYTISAERTIRIHRLLAGRRSRHQRRWSRCRRTSRSR